MMISTHKSNSAVLESLQRQIDKAKIEVHACDVVMGILREPKYRRFRALGRVVAPLKAEAVQRAEVLHFAIQAVEEVAAKMPSIEPSTDSNEP